MAPAIGAAIFALGGAAGVAAGATVIIPGLTLAGLVGSVVVTGALVGAPLLLAPKPEVPKGQDGKILIKAAIPPIHYGVGESRITGPLVASEMRGSISYEVQAYSEGPIDSFVQFYLHEDPVNFLEGDSGGVWYPPADSRYTGDDPGEQDVRIYWRLGAIPETAYAELVTALPLLWTTNHRGDGVASTLTVCATPNDKALTRRLPFGLVKTSAAGRWSIAWDPRDETQDVNNRLTWKYTRNPFVLALHFQCHWKPGYRKPLNRVYAPVAEYWHEAMNVCDEERLRSDETTEPKYQASGFFTSETARKSIVEALARCCDGFFMEVGGGTIVPFAGKFYEPDLTITDEHVIDSTIIQNYSEKDRVNQLNVKVVSREHGYNEVPADPWGVTAETIENGDIIVAKDAQAEWSPSWVQSRYLAKIEYDKKTAKIRGTLVLNLFGENLKYRRFFKLDLKQRGNATRNVICEIDDLVDQSMKAGIWLVEFHSVRPERYDWTTAEEGRPPPIPDNSDNEDTPIPGLPTLAIIRRVIAGVKFPVISATVPPVEGWPELGLTGRYRKLGETDWQKMTGESGVPQCFSGPVDDGTYQVQVSYVGGGGGEGEYSPIATIAVVSDNEAPDPPENLQADDTSGVISLSARTGDKPNNVKIIFKRGSMTQLFSDASELDRLNASANQVISLENTPGFGLHRYWAETANLSDVLSGAPISQSVEVLRGAYNFAADEYVGPALTIIGGANGWVENVAGVWAAGRRSNKGRLIEPAATNHIRDSAFSGAVAGSPGTVPASLILTVPTGLTRTVSVGTTDGVEWIEISYVGTTSSTAAFTVNLEATTQIVAASGEVWSGSAWVRVTQDDPAVSVLVLGVVERAAVGTALTLGSTSFYATRTSWLRRNHLRTLINASTARMTPYVATNSIASGTAVDFAIRIGWPQAEKDRITSPIRTTVGAVTRTADDVSLTLPSGSTNMKFEFDDNSEQAITVSPGSYTFPTNLNRFQVKRMIFY